MHPVFAPLQDASRGQAPGQAGFEFFLLPSKVHARPHAGIPYGDDVPLHSAAGMISQTARPQPKGVDHDLPRDSKKVLRRMEYT